MITLYVKSHCPYSAKALAAFDVYNVPFEEKNIADPGVESELMEIGHKHKVPFLVDGETHIYESDAIVSYIEERFGHLNDTGIRFAKSDTNDTEGPAL